MHWAWPDWTRFSALRVRLAVWNTAVVLLMTAASLVAARFVARATLYDDADAELRAGALEVVLAIQDLSPNLDAAVAQIQRMARSHEQRGWFVHLLTEDGVTIWKSQLCPEQVVSFPPANTDRDEVVVQVGPYRYVRLRIVEPNQPVYHLRVGTYTTGLDDRLTSLMRQLTIVGSALLLLTPFAGWWLARRATQPVGDILQVADALRPTRLADRLPVRGTRDELDRLSQTINRLLDEVAGHVDRQRQFIADAAHELRGPLAAMQSALEVAAGKPRRAEEYQETVESVLEECRRLTRVANDLLRLAEGESDGGQEQRLEVDLAPLVRRMGNMFSGAAEERGIRIRVATPESVAVRCRPRQLGQVCSNLLDNAIRFTPSGGSVDVTLAIDGPRREATLTVEDTGRGIEPAILPKVFDRFFQADAARDRGDASRGGGLGLAICKAIVDGHGGSIEATSRPGRGSTFVVRLPLA